MKKKDDALASAVAELRSASEPRRVLLAEERARELIETRRANAAARRELDELRARLREKAPAADSWFRRFVTSGRFDLVRRARADQPADRLALPRIWIVREHATFDDPEHHDGYWFHDVELGRRHTIFAGQAGPRRGGAGGNVAPGRSLTQLARKDGVRPVGRRPWPDMEANVRRVAILVTELIASEGFEPMLIGRLRTETRHVRRLAERDAAEIALIRDEPNAEARYRATITKQGLTNRVLTADMQVHITKRSGRGRTRPR